MEDLGSLVWFVMIVIWVISSMVQKAREFKQNRPGQTVPQTPPGQRRQSDPTVRQSDPTRRQSDPTRRQSDPTVRQSDPTRRQSAPGAPQSTPAELRDEASIDPMEEIRKAMLRSLGVEPEPAAPPPPPRRLERHTDGQSLLEHLEEAAAHQPTASEHLPTPSEHRLTPSEHRMGMPTVARTRRRRPTAPVAGNRRRRHPLAIALRSPSRLADAIVAREVLDPPLALRPEGARTPIA